MRFVDIRSVISSCETCKTTLSICGQNQFKRILIDKLYHDTYNFNNLTINQLLYYAKSFPCKRKMCIAKNKLIVVTKNFVHVVLFGHGNECRSYINKNVNQIIRNFGNDVLQLNNDGNVVIKNIKKKDNALYFNMAKRGKNAIFYDSKCKQNIIQTYKNMMLSNNGEIFINDQSNKIEIPNN